MIKLKLILTILLVLTTIKSECGEGCLKCDIKRNKCIFCDPKENYKTIRGNCIKAKNENCAISSLDGNCLHCKEKYFLDLYTFRCVEIPKEGTVMNCLEYVGNNRCSKCEDSFFLNRENECMELSSPISNCEVYKSSDECILCEKGYLLGIDYKTCEEPSKLDNCGRYTQLKCVSCDSGYIKNENNFIYELLGFYNKRNVKNLEQEFVLETGINLSTCRSNTCQRLSVENCAVYASFDECLKCLPNYFQLEGQCIQYPQERIPHCLTYSSLQTCTSCEKKMYLKSETECVTVEPPVENCSKYDTSANTPSCSECFSNYFLSEPNICTKRSVDSTITNCTTLFIDQEKCQICALNFVSTDDRKACLPIVKNCDIYVGSDVSNGDLECNTCIEGYYYDGNTKLCVQGGKEFCKVYERDTNECLVCENRYYLAGGECEPHEDLVYCGVYSNVLKDSCLDCNDKTQKFERMNTCLRVEEIAFCDVYESTTSCQVCYDGYFLTNLGKCQIIPGEEFCLQKNGANCVKCLKNYILENGSCSEPLFHLMKNCDSHTVNGTNDYSELKCNYCRVNTIPVDYKDSYVCYEEDYIQGQLGVTLVENCLKYKINGAGYDCMSCDKGTVLEDGACVEECLPENTLRSHVIQYFKSDGSSNFDNIFIEKNKECGQKVPHCKEASPDLLQDFNNFSYSCVVCEDETISQVKFDNRRVLIRPPHENNDNTDFSPLSYSPSKDCIPISDASTKIIGDLSNNRTSVPFCDLYYDLEIGYGCLKCMRGYTGEVVDIIYQCQLYENLTTCKKCNQGYYLKENYLCIKNSPVLNCIEYGSESVDECKLCKDGFYLSAPTECTERAPILYCKVYQFDTEECEECDLGYIAVGNDCVKQIVKCLADFHSGNPPVCDKCEIGYYRFEDKCMPGIIPNCLQYELDIVNTCEICEDNYYLEDNSCTLQSRSLDEEDNVLCSEYSQEKGYCNKCFDTYFLFENKKQCVAITTITNCIEYSSENLCKKCDDLTYISALGKKCLAIPTDWNCIEWGEFPSENHCVQCKPTYVLYEDTCHKWFDVQIEYCPDEYLTDNPRENHKKCKYCQAGSSANNNYNSIDLNSFGICMEEDFFNYLKKFKNGTSALHLRIPENCDRYEFKDGVLICKRCSNNFYVLSKNEGGTIITYCITEANCVGITDHYPAYTSIELFNTDLVKVIYGPSCIELSPTDYNLINLENCYVSPLLHSTEVIYRCTRCFDGFISIISLTKTNAEIGFYNHRMFSNSYYKITDSAPVIDKCVKAITLDISGLQLNSYNELRDCKYYYEYTADTYGCLACDFGFTGKLMPLDSSPTNGYIDSCHQETIAECKQTTVEEELVSMRSLYHPDLFENSLNKFDLGILFTSCQICNTGFIPTVKVSSSTSGLYGKISGLANGGTAPAPVLRNEGAEIVSLGTLNANDCTDITGAVTVIENCAYALEDIPLDGGPAPIQPGTTDKKLYCVACNPGYRPVAAQISVGGLIGLVKECVLIENCDLTTNPDEGDNIINSCTTCNTTGSKIYAWLYDETNKRVKTDTCSETTTKNCMAVTSSLVCILCMPGLTLVNNACIQRVPHLSQPLKQDITNLISINDLQTLFTIYSEPPGIDSCVDPAYFPIINYNELFQNAEIGIPAIDRICLENSHEINDLSMSTYVNSDAENLIDNCNSTVDYTTYGFNLLENDRVDCIQCAVDYISSDDGKCVLEADFEFCILGVGLNSSFCKECSSGYVAVAGICLRYDPLNYNLRPVVDCEIFDEDAFATHIKCDKCKDGTMMQTSEVDNKITYTCVSPGENEVSFCSQYNSENENHIYCIECIHTYSLMILDGDLVDLGNGLEPGYNRICLNIISITDINCSSYNKTDLESGKLICETCKPDYILKEKSDYKNACTQIPTVPNCQSYNLVTTLFDNHYDPNLSNFACNSCLPGNYLKQIIGSTYTCETRLNVTSYNDNCAKFEPYSDSCKTCSPNFVLDIELNTCEPAVTTTKKGSILNCAKMETCNVEVKYDGLHPHLESIASCHQCRDPNQIPFVAIAGDASFTKIHGIGKYGIDSSADAYKTLDGGKAVFCETPDYEKFGHDDILKFNFPLNCAIGVLNVNSDKDSTSSSNFDPNVGIDRAKVAVFCGACRPGYKATYNIGTINTVEKVDFVITKCDLIPNCIQKNSFNYCTKCAIGFSFEYANDKVNFDSCVSDNGNLSCYAYDLSTSKCILCNKGTYLNKDGNCESINPPRCEFNQFNFRNNYFIDTFNVGLFLNNEGTGCNKCKKGYKSIFEPNNYFICTESEVHSKQNLPVSTQYINNCKNYHVLNNLLRCITCHDGFVPLQTTGVCTEIGPISNCALALTPNTCSKCVDRYVTVNRLCEIQSLENCSDYSHDHNNQEQRCLECEEGYFVSDFTCDKGDVENCLIFETKTVCNKCNDNFQLVTRSGGISYCFPIDKRLSCRQFNRNQFQIGKLECDECINNLFVKNYEQNNFFKTHCMKFSEVPNCVQYDIKPANADSSFTCQKCTPNFFLSNINGCILRTVVPENCDEFKFDEDKCLNCEKGFYLSENSECIVFPTGVPYCRIYGNSTTCNSCIENKYLSPDNNCLEIPENRLIENCKYYVAEAICEICEPNYLLREGGTCVPIQALNCKTLETITTCQSCADTFGFKEENGIKSCIQINQPNCLINEDEEPHNCITCDSKNYVSEGLCAPILEEIPGCLEYTSETICNKCNSSTALSLDQQSCVSTARLALDIDQNCEETQVIEKAVCNTCKSGHVFVNGVCTACETDMDRCYSCDPKALDVCLLCNSGYFMTVDLACLLLSELPKKEEEGEGGDGNGDGNGDENGDGNGDGGPVVDPKENGGDSGNFFVKIGIEMIIFFYYLF